MNKAETINILCATDNNYAPCCGIMLTSLFDSNRDCCFNVYVFIDDDLSETNIKKYNRLGQKYGNIINLMKIDNSMVEGFPIIPGHITRPTYYRLLAAELLPNDVHRVIYLDSDLVVVGDIKPLWNVDIEGKALTCVLDSIVTIDIRCNRLGYPTSFGYFNAGVLMMNLRYWRENHVISRVKDYIVGYYQSLNLMDQDILNGVLYGEKLLLPERYNFQIYAFLLKRWNGFSDESRRNYIDESLKLRIIHYVGREKPWNYRSYGGPFFLEWEKYRRKSLWCGCRNIKPLKKHVKHMVKRYLFPGMFRKLHPEWIVLPENKKYYR